jgi:hypothetical protein
MIGMPRGLVFPLLEILIASYIVLQGLFWLASGRELPRSKKTRFWIWLAPGIILLLITLGNLWFSARP